MYDNKKERTDIIVDESDWRKVYTSIKLEEKWTDIIKEEAIDKRYTAIKYKVERTNIIEDEGDWQVRYTAIKLK